MRVGFIGLGRMGANMVRRLVRDGHEVVAFNRTPERTREIMTEGVEGAFSLLELVGKLPAPRVVWVMVPAGDATEAMIAELMGLLEPGDTIVDGGNTNFHDDVRRHARVAEKGVGYVDAGTSGGVWGLEVGYCLMVGGDREAVEPLEPIFRTLAPADGYAHVGGPGAGHYVKMVHNGIEYGLMQAYAEGFEIMHASDYDLDLAQVSGIWRYGSVVRSWLLDLLYDALAMRFDEVNLRRDPACPLCSPKATILELQDYPAFCGAGRGRDTEPVDEIGAGELKRRLDAGEPIEIIDVREPREWAICRIEGARLVPLGSLAAHVGDLDPARTYVLQCRSGARSARALELLRQAGFRRLLSLRGGILAWAREVDPTMPTY